MSEPDGKRPASPRLYAWLLRLYPAKHRHDFAAQMLRTFRDLYADEVARNGRAGPGFWLEVIGDEARGIIRAYFDARVGAVEADMNPRREWLVGIGLGLVWLAVPLFWGLGGRTVGVAAPIGFGLAGALLLGLAALVLAAAGWLRNRLRREQAAPAPLAAGPLKHWRIGAGWVGAVAVANLALAATMFAAQLAASAAGGLQSASGLCSAGQTATGKPPATLASAQDYLAQGDYDFDRGECSQALADYSQAIALDPNFAEAYNNRAYTYMALQDYALALPDLDQAIALRPNYVNALMNRGDIYNFYYAIDRQRALADYDRVLALDPVHNSVCGHRALALQHLDDTASNTGLSLGTLRAMASTPGCTFENMVQ